MYIWMNVFVPFSHSSYYVQVHVQLRISSKLCWQVFVVSLLEAVHMQFHLESVKWLILKWADTALAVQL